MSLPWAQRPWRGLALVWVCFVLLSCDKIYPFDHVRVYSSVSLDTLTMVCNRHDYLAQNFSSP